MQSPRPNLTSTAGRGALPTGDWLRALRRYLVAIVFGNLVWEVAQLPLYTIWHEGSTSEIVFAVVHCTGGDVLIAGTALLGALLIAGNGRWPHAGYRMVAVIAILGGLAYTIFSEWLNTEIRGSWAYTEWMPQLPILGAGISPFAQWIVVPLAAFWWTRRPFPRAEQPKEARA
jgi:hypothetical protein